MMALGNDVTYYQEKSPEGQTEWKILDGGENPPYGVLITYHLKEAPAEAVTLTIMDHQGEVIKTFSSQTDQDKSADDPSLPAKEGLNRFVWDMRYPDALKATGDVTTEKSKTGPTAPPGTYQAQLQAGNHVSSQTFEIRLDPRVQASQADMQAQFELWFKIRDKVSETHAGINQIRRIKRQVADLTRYLRETNGLEGQIDLEPITEAAEALQEKLVAIETELVQTQATSAFDRLRLPSRLNTKLIGLISVVAAADAAPPKQAYEVFEHLSGLIDTQLAQLKTVVETDVAAFNDLVRQANVPAVIT